MGEQQLVVFNLAKEFYGVAIEQVNSIIKPLPLTKIPLAKKAVEGVINLRGEVLPVVNLRTVFSLPDQTTTNETRVIVMKVEQTKIGLIVDGVSEVLRVADEDFEAPSALLTNYQQVVQSIVNRPEKIIAVLAMDKILSVKEAKIIKDTQLKK